MVAKRIFSDFSATTSAHGLPHTGSARNPCLCVFWAFIVILATGAFVWQMYQLIQTYLAYESNIQTQLYMGERPFPAITVCNLNPYKKSAVGNTLIGSLMLQYTEAMRVGNTSDRPTTENRTDFGLFDSSLNGERAKIQARAEDGLVYLTSTDQSLRNTGTYTREEFISSCVFNTKSCNDSDIEMHMDPVYGACYTFNNKTMPYTASRPGPTYGLKLLLITDQSEYLEMTEMAGVRMTVQSQGEPSFPDVFGYNAAPGYTNGFSVSYTRMNRAGRPYDDCITDRDGATNFYTDKYTTEACVRSYSQRMVMDKCNCAYPRLSQPPSSALPYCDLKSLSCVSDVLESQENMNTIQQYCKRPCTEHTYDVAVSSAVWPGSYTVRWSNEFFKPRNGSKDAFQPNTCDDVAWLGNTDKCKGWYANNSLVVEIFYESMVYQVLNELPAYTLLNFISDTGGQMGLWLGFYAVTILEFIALMFSLFCCCFCGCDLGTRKTE